MIQRRTVVTIAACCALVAGARLLPAQATVYVPASDAVYLDVRMLIANGLADSTLVASRPYSRRALSAVVAEATERLRGDDVRFAAIHDAAQAALDRIRLAADLPDDEPVRGHTRVISNASLTAIAVSSPSRVVPTGGLFPIDATLNPLTGNAEGRTIADGGTLALETTHALEPLPWLAVGARARLAALAPRGQDAASVRGELLDFYARGVWRKLAVEAGREHLVWGQSREASLTFSLNAPGLDMVRVASDAPFRLPWVFRRAGPVTANMFLADLGKHYVYPHARLAGWQFSVAPVPSFEIGLLVTDVLGGTGSPPASLKDKIADFFPLIDALFITQSDFEFSNKQAGGSLRVRRSNAEVYWELVFDDFDARRVWSSIWLSGANEIGVHIPRLNRSGTLSLTTEAHHLGLHMYQHGQFQSGMTFHGTLLGDQLGARGNAVYSWLDWARPRSRWSLSAAYERRSNDQWELLVADAHAHGYHFVRLDDRPEEFRARVGVTWDRSRGAGRAHVSTQAALERVTNFDFNAGDSRTNAIVSVSLTGLVR